MAADAYTSNEAKELPVLQATPTVVEKIQVVSNSLACGSVLNIAVLFATTGMRITC